MVRSVDSDTPVALTMSAVRWLWSYRRIMSIFSSKDITLRGLLAAPEAGDLVLRLGGIFNGTAGTDKVQIRYRWAERRTSQLSLAAKENGLTPRALGRRSLPNYESRVMLAR